MVKASSIEHKRNQFFRILYIINRDTNDKILKSKCNKLKHFCAILSYNRLINRYVLLKGNGKEIIICMLTQKSNKNAQKCKENEKNG